MLERVTRFSSLKSFLFYCEPLTLLLCILPFCIVVWYLFDLVLSWFKSKFSQKGRLFFVLFSAGLLSGIYLLCNQVTGGAAGSGREGTRG